MSSRFAAGFQDLDMGLAGRIDREHEEGKHRLRALQAGKASHNSAPPPLPRVVERSELEARHEQFFKDDDLLNNPSEFVNILGYQHGYNKMPVDYDYLALLLERYFPRATHADVDPEDFEIIYIDSHMAGYEQRLDRDAYAVEHGAKRGPSAPDLGLPMGI